MTDLTATPHGSNTSPWDTCFHREPGFELVKEAEQVAIFHDHNNHRMHISVQDEDWFSCRTVPCTHYDNMDLAEEMAIIDDQLKFLRTLRE